MLNITMNVNNGELMISLEGKLDAMTSRELEFGMNICRWILTATEEFTR